MYLFRLFWFCVVFNCLEVVCKLFTGMSLQTRTQQCVFGMICDRDEGTPLDVGIAREYLLRLLSGNFDIKNSNTVQVISN